MSEFRLLPAGDTSLVVQFGDRVERDLSARVLALARRLDALALPGVVETVPTFRSLMVYYEPLVLPAAALTMRIRELLADLTIAEPPGRKWRLPACYDAEFAPDLDQVAVDAGLSRQEVIDRHSGPLYHVYMLGFLPGQAYMGDVPKELELPRRPTPRLRIAAGSLAIANKITCIFPMETPCGWHVIGRSPIPLWQNSMCSALLAPGDTVSFSPVSLREYREISNRLADGSFKLSQCAELPGIAA